MVKRKTERTTFEYFKVDEMFFVGKHREYIDKLWVQNKIDESYVKRLVDLYAIAAVVGLRTGRTSPEVGDGTDIKRTVQMKQLTENYQTLSNIMRLVLLFDDSRGLNVEQRMESAFVIPESEEVYRANMELFNSYARGGIEVLYEQLILRQVDIDDDYSDSRISNIVAMVNNPLEKEDFI
jgi:hypothetical protein